METSEWTEFDTVMSLLRQMDDCVHTAVLNEMRASVSPVEHAWCREEMHTAARMFRTFLRKHGMPSLAGRFEPWVAEGEWHE